VQELQEGGGNNTVQSFAKLFLPLELLGG